MLDAFYLNTEGEDFYEDILIDYEKSEEKE